MSLKTTKFGILHSTKEDDRYFYIYNKGEQRKISKNKFKNLIPKLN